MSAAQRYEAEALGLTPEGTTPGRRTLTEGLCPASDQAESETHPQPEGGGARSGGGREREALRPGFGAEPQGRSQCAAGGRVTPPAKNQQAPAPRPQQGTDAGNNARQHSSSPVGQVSASRPPCPKTTCTPIRVVGRRVDALVIGFKVDSSTATLRQLAGRQAIADTVGTAELRFGALAFALKRTHLTYFPQVGTAIWG